MKLLDFKIKCLVEMINCLQEEIVFLEPDDSKKRYSYRGVIKLSCASLKAAWDSLCLLIMSDFNEIDLRDIGDKLKPICDVSISIFKKCSVAYELANVKEWLESFPTNDSTRRDLARTAIAAGNCITIEELIERL